MNIFISSKFMDVKLIMYSKCCGKCSCRRLFLYLKMQMYTHMYM